MAVHPADTRKGTPVFSAFPVEVLRLSSVAAESEPLSTVWEALVRVTELGVVAERRSVQHKPEVWVQLDAGWWTNTHNMCGVSTVVLSMKGWMGRHIMW
jgi:hypothetical protein